jgi:hypothetical protein
MVRLAHLHKDAQPLSELNVEYLRVNVGAFVK